MGISLLVSTEQQQSVLETSQVGVSHSARAQEKLRRSSLLWVSLGSPWTWIQEHVRGRRSTFHAACGEATGRHLHPKQSSAVTCSFARSSCSTKSSRSWAAKCLMPISSSPSLCLAIVILNSCIFHYWKQAKEKRKNINEYIPQNLTKFLCKNFWMNKILARTTRIKYRTNYLPIL